MTQHGVRLALAEEDAKDLGKGDRVAVHDDISPAMLIAAGIDIEVQQYVFVLIRSSILF